MKKYFLLCRLIAMQCVVVFIFLGFLTVSVDSAQATSPSVPKCSSDTAQKVEGLFEDEFPDYEWDEKVCHDFGTYYEFIVWGEIESSGGISYLWRLDFLVGQDFKTISYHNVVDADDLVDFIDLIESTDSFEELVLNPSSTYKYNKGIGMKEGERNIMMSHGSLYVVNFITDDPNTDIVSIINSKDFSYKLTEDDVLETIDLSKKGIKLLNTELVEDDFYDLYTSTLKSVLVPTQVPAFTHKYSRDLTLGDTGDDVMYLQQRLNLTGFTVAASGPGSMGNETKYFGPATKAALIKYQNANLIALGIIQGTGYFGPLTRSKLNEASSDTSPIIVISPNGGESWQLGSTQNISWKTSGISNAQGISIYLIQNLSGCFNLKPGGTCLPVVDPKLTIASGVSNNGSYTWKVGTYLKNDQNTTTSEGTYFVKICKLVDGYDDKNKVNYKSEYCDNSDSTFTISSTVSLNHSHQSQTV